MIAIMAILAIIFLTIVNVRSVRKVHTIHHPAGIEKHLSMALKCNKFNADRKRTFGPVRHCGAFPGIAMASTNSQDAFVKALSLQDALCLVSFDV